MLSKVASSVGLVLLVACGQASRAPAMMNVMGEPAPPPSAAGPAGASGAAGQAQLQPPQPSAGMSRTPAAGAASPAAGSPARMDPMPMLDAGAPVAPSDAAVDTGAADAGTTLEPCPMMQYKAGDNREQLELQSRMRHFTVYVPAAIKPAARVALVLDFHGNGGSGMQEESSSGWRQKADKEGFAVVYPDGVGNGWNVGNCCGEALSSNSDDVGFAKAIVTTVSAAMCIDPKRVYATGLSNGAGLAHRIGCEAADVFAAIAAASADLVTDPCKPARPISELSVRGLSDTLVAYAGGNTGSTGWYSPGAKGTLDLWKKIDACTGMLQMPRQYCEGYTGCESGVEITLCSLPGTGHILYMNSLGFDVPEVAWEMFKRQPMP